MSEMLGLGDPGIAGISVAQGGYRPTPNSAPLGSETGAPPHTRFFSLPIPPAIAVKVDPGTRNNRVVFITPPFVGFTVFVGGADVTPLNGMALTPALTTECVLPGFQELWVTTNAPVLLRVQIQIASILLAEQERRL